MEQRWIGGCKRNKAQRPLRDTHVKIDHIRDLALKIMGIYFLRGAASLVSHLADTLSFKLYAGQDWEPWTMVFTEFIPFGTSLLFSYLLLFRTRSICRLLWSEERESRENRAAVLTIATCVGLVAFYYSLNGLQELTWGLGGIVANEGSRHTRLWDLGGHVVFLLVTILCMVKTRTIAGYLNRWAQKTALEVGIGSECAQDDHSK